MKKIMCSSVVLLVLLFSSNQLFADVRLPAILGDHMVLQQNTKVKFWGWCNTGEKISVRSAWDTTTYKAEGDGNAKWELTIQTPKAGGPYTIEVSGDNKIVLQDVLIGEVWDCSGQSNMEWNFFNNKKQPEEISEARNESIRFFNVPRATALYPQEDTRGKWVVCNPEDAQKFSLVGYFFGKELNAKLQLPVGLINASWGGTPVETWTPSPLIESDTVLLHAAQKINPSKWWPVKPALAYNGMVYPNTSFPIAGVIWYQGESNVGTSATYSAAFSMMIKSWRKAWQKDFPFYYVQIAPYSGYGNSNGSSILKEQQTKTLSLVPNAGMVVVTDLVDDVKDIHPRNKKDVGVRLANLALSKTYGLTGLPYQYPVYKSMSVEKSSIRISFDDVTKALMQKGDTLRGFYIAGEDKIFVPATAKIDGNAVTVSHKDIKKPVAVRFGFTSADTPNLFSKEGLPVIPFRTDDWDEVATLK